MVAQSMANLFANSQSLAGQTGSASIFSFLKKPAVRQISVDDMMECQLNGDENVPVHLRKGASAEEFSRWVHGDLRQQALAALDEM